MRRLTLICLLVLLGGCVSVSPFDVAPQRTTLAQARVILPTTSEPGSDLLFVEAKINGAGPYRLLVDTGAQSLALTRQMAQAAKIAMPARQTISVINAVGESVPASLVRIGRVEVGDLTLEGVNAILFEDADHADVTTVIKADGVLGMSALKDVVLEMDFPARQIAVSRPGTERYPVDRAVSYVGVRPNVFLEIAGKAQPMAIDTGSGGALTLPGLEGLPLLVPVTKAMGSGVVAGKSVGPRGVQSQLDGESRLGPVTWTNPPVESSGNRESGLIGLQALKHGKIVIDPHQQRIYFLGDELQRTWPKQETAHPHFALGFFAEVEGTALRLVEVDPDGAADLAGLRVGDMLLSVDGTPAVTPVMKSHRARVRVEREGKEFETTLAFAPDYSPRQTLLAADRVTLPSSLVRGALVVEGKINDAGPFRFLVGTGAAALRVSPRVAEAAGAKNLPDWPARGPGSTANVVWIDRFVAGGIELKGMAATIVEPGSLSYLRTNFGDLDGFLGLEAMKDVVLELDFPRREVSVVKSGTGTYPQDRAVAYRGAAPRVTLDVAGRRQNALIDTASAGGFDLPLLNEVPLLFPKTRNDEIGLSRAYERGERGQLDGEIRLGPIAWLNPPIASRGVPRIGVVSLGAWRLAIDQQASRIYFLDGNLQRRANRVTPPAPSTRAGYFARLEGDRLHLVEVDQGGAFARAGLQSGDVIVTVDDRSVTEYFRQPGGFGARLQQQPRMRVLRGASEFEVVFPPAAGALPP